MKKTIVAVAVLGIIFSCRIAYAGEDRETFYRMQIDGKIAQCERKAAMLGNTAGNNARASAKRACEQAEFYRSRKDELVREMVRLNIGSRPAKVNHFLIESFDGRSVFGY